MFPSSPMYLRSYLAASVSVGSLSAVSSMANTAFCLNSALSSKLILASKQTTADREQKCVGIQLVANSSALLETFNKSLIKQRGKLAVGIL